jgi:hypothetical protein
VDPVSDPLLVRKSGSAGNRTRTYGSVARISDYYTTEAVLQPSTRDIIAYMAIKVSKPTKRCYIDATSPTPLNKDIFI